MLSAAGAAGGRPAAPGGGRRHHHRRPHRVRPGGGIRRAARDAGARLHVPVYVIPGNHDRREVLLRELPGVRLADGFVQYAVEDLPVRLVMLDTVVPGAGHGELCADRLAWLDRTLAAAPHNADADRHAPPAFRLRHRPHGPDRAADPAALLAVVARHPQVAAHRLRPSPPADHGPLRPGHRQHLPLGRASGRAGPGSEGAPPRFVLEPPAYQIHRWRPDTGIVTHTALVESYPARSRS